ncbi:MAG: transcriptional repressor [Bifidobacteriaceae bacterium]|jgi:Fur family ferric uptake transcriptional regulator|nr:transcriptional repressor [Bifidobacteriaceae bacterium]
MPSSAARAQLSQEPQARLRAARLRVTPARLAVLEALAADDHLDAEHVAQAVRAKLGAVATQTVYDALATLSSRGLIGQIEPAGHNRLFEARTADNHHHVICRVCRRIEDVDCAVGHTPCLTASDNHGFLIDQAEVTYWGLCPDCRTTDQTTTQPTDQTATRTTQTTDIRKKEPPS